MPPEVHEYRDPAGELLGTITVKRESVWDDIARGQALGLVEYDESICSCGCGLPREDAHQDQGFIVDVEKCYAARAVEKVKRKARADAEQRNSPEGWDDGLHYFARVMPEDEQQDRRRPTRG